MLSGADEAKNTTPDIKWHKNFTKKATNIPKVRLSLKYPASPIAIEGSG